MWGWFKAAWVTAQSQGPLKARLLREHLSTTVEQCLPKKTMTNTRTTSPERLLFRSLRKGLFRNGQRDGGTGGPNSVLPRRKAGHQLSRREHLCENLRRPLGLQSQESSWKEGKEEQLHSSCTAPAQQCLEWSPWASDSAVKDSQGGCPAFQYLGVFLRRAASVPFLGPLGVLSRLDYLVQPNTQQQRSSQQPAWGPGGSTFLPVVASDPIPALASRPMEPWGRLQKPQGQSHQA